MQSIRKRTRVAWAHLDFLRVLPFPFSRAWLVGRSINKGASKSFIAKDKVCWFSLCQRTKRKPVLTSGKISRSAGLFPLKLLLRLITWKSINLIIVSGYKGGQKLKIPSTFSSLNKSWFCREGAFSHSSGRTIGNSAHSGRYIYYHTQSLPHFSNFISSIYFSLLLLRLT